MFNKHRKFVILLLLIAIAGGFVALSWVLINHKKSTDWHKEVGEGVLTLGMSVIIGGLVKFFVDSYQEEGRKYTRRKEFRRDLLTRLRGTFDAVDASRLLIKAHRSAKTYGERVRENILPSITTLYDIKRSLVDSQNSVDHHMLAKLRVSLHYMIAYLTALGNEYEEQYRDISNSQFFQEAVQQKQKELFIGRLSTSEQGLQLRPDTPIPPAPDFAWKKLVQLPYLHDFLSEDRDSRYYLIFVDHYEHCKRLLKQEAADAVLKLPEQFDPAYLSMLAEMDASRDAGVKPGGANLVNRIIGDQLNISSLK
ncbi:hypothetical protein [Paraflavitalea sp. CAU 1676]|uniref:hypothetical protein n=1 Tax=Paraflavitalea sp. CAU 1676 TaxID=3032598 RepID=UPI0023DA77F8|nr:hypothetical protein [Paraflavitalea sp. CAU 1676]MDF2188099.1 hypothetical protein [Paraflavitalea sp. CAU 1676]